MDQDFHYFATYTAARIVGFDYDEAAILARAANYVDFFSESRFRGYWVFKKGGREIATVNYPRYTFQANLTGNAVGAEGLWAAFHFLPGNYKVDGQHAMQLPPNLVKQMSQGTFTMRDQTSGDDVSSQWRLTRPLGALSRAIVTDLHLLAKDGVREILEYGPGLKDFIAKEKDHDTEKRFLNILTGLRSHVIADTWAHQDFTGVRSVINTYYDVDDVKKKPYGIRYKVPVDEKKKQYYRMKYGDDYKFPGEDYTYRVLWEGHPFQGMEHTGKDEEYKRVTADKAFKQLKKERNNVFAAAPAIGKLAYLGHGWMGHLPDYSFISYKYRPTWMKNYAQHERNNPEVYLDAFYDILYLLHVVKEKEKEQSPWLIPWLLKVTKTKDLIKKAITSVWTANSEIPRVFSADAWRTCIKDMSYQLPPPLNTFIETGDHAKLDGEQNVTFKGKKVLTAYGTFTMEIMNDKGKPCDFYLFQLAADYHFHYVKSWLKIFRKHTLNDSWSTQPGPLGSDVSKLTDQRVEKLKQPLKRPQQIPPAPPEPQQHKQPPPLMRQKGGFLKKEK